MVIEHNIDILEDSELGELHLIHIDSKGLYYHFEFYPEILN